eukprot:TRINITY_DN12715_c0_g1_i1.p1 TRINITY_DN12715_c0_g1~~TRINITY_DN12715_c0_g1_i1.p1  ORF type:complete len:570 (+),score=114.06 TRINITY_DN12715_c0_g1_i1:330-2039(+)
MRLLWCLQMAGSGSSMTTYAASMVSADGWFWVVDDDICGFYGVRDGKVVSVQPREALAAAVVLEAAADAHVAIVGLEYQNFMVSRDRERTALGRPSAHNSYCNVVVALNRERLPASAQYRFRCREDFDFAVQVIAAGRQTRRIRHLGFNNGGMGNIQGGMWSYYDKAEREDIVNGTAMLWAWRQLWSTGAVAKKYRAPRCSGAGAGRDRLHVGVNWAKLASSNPLPPAPAAAPAAVRPPNPPPGTERPASARGDLNEGSKVALCMGDGCEAVRGGWWTAEVRGRETCGRYRLRWLNPEEFVPGSGMTAERWAQHHGDWLLELPEGAPDWRVLEAGPGPRLRRPSPAEAPQPGTPAREKAPQWFTGIEEDLAKDQALKRVFTARCRLDFAPEHAPSAAELAAGLPGHTAAAAAPLADALATWLRLLKPAFLAATRGKGLPAGEAKVGWNNKSEYAKAFFEACRAFDALERPGGPEDWRAFIRIAARCCVAAGLPLSSYGPVKLKTKLADYLHGGTRYNAGALPLQERVERAARRAALADPAPPPQAAAAAAAPAAKRSRRTGPPQDRVES